MLLGFGRRLPLMWAFDVEAIGRNANPAREFVAAPPRHQNRLPPTDEREFGFQ